MYESLIKEMRKIFDTSDFIPLHAPVFKGNEKVYLEDCIDSTFVSSVGKYVDEFEQKLAEFTGSKKAVAVVNGTAALHVSLILSGVEAGDEVITQAFTFVATANAISHTGAKPIFVDINRENLGMCSKKLNDFLDKNTEFKDGVCRNKNTGAIIKACVPMHSFGHICDIKEIVEICEKYNIAVIEDAAEALGSFKDGKHAGTFSDIGAISFNGNKVITTGGGGALLFDDEELAAKAKHITTTAKIPHKWEFKHDSIAFNYRMPNVNAAIGVAQLESLVKYLENKRSLAEEYKALFNDHPVEFFDEPSGCRSNFWLNSVLLNNKAERDTFLSETNSRGVMTRPAWELMTNLEMFKDSISDGLENSIDIQSRLVNIPSGVRT